MRTKDHEKDKTRTKDKMSKPTKNEKYIGEAK